MLNCAILCNIKNISAIKRNIAAEYKKLQQKIKKSEIEFNYTILRQIMLIYNNIGK